MRKVTSLILAFTLVFSSFAFIPSVGQVAHADEQSSFLISEYGSDETSGSTSAYWRGYVFQVSEDLIITHLAGGGGGVNGGYVVGIYPIDTEEYLGNTGTSGTCFTTSGHSGAPSVPCVKPGQPLGYTATTTSAGADQKLPVIGGNYDDGNKISLEKDTYYLLASGAVAANYDGQSVGNHWIVQNIDVDDITGGQLIKHWSPNIPNAKTYRWTSSTSYGSGTGYGGARFVSGMGQNNVTGDTLPMLGFWYEDIVPLALVITQPATLGVGGIVLNGLLDNTGAGVTTASFQYGKTANLAGGDTQNTPAVEFAGESYSHPLSVLLEAGTDFDIGATYYFRARANNLAGFADGATSTFKVLSLEYEVDNNKGTLTGNAFQLVMDGGNGSAVSVSAKLGYAFTGWNDASDDNPRTDTGVTASDIFVAEFSPAITFNSQGGSSVGAIIEDEGELISIPPAPSRSGYTFMEWNEMPDASGAPYGPGDEIAMPATGFPLYAIWEQVPTSPSSSSRSSGQSAPTTITQAVSAIQSMLHSLVAQLIALGGTPPAGWNNNTGTPPPVAENSARDLTIGMTGTDVTALQNLLISQGHPISAGATGYFATQTRAALAAYQEANGISPAIGYFGPTTRAQMKNAGLQGLWW